MAAIASNEARARRTYSASGCTSIHALRSASTSCACVSELYGNRAAASLPFNSAALCLSASASNKSCVEYFMSSPFVKLNGVGTLNVARRAARHFFALCVPQRNPLSPRRQNVGRPGVFWPHGSPKRRQAHGFVGGWAVGVFICLHARSVLAAAPIVSTNVLKALP